MNFIRRMLYGRYGPDRLGRFLMMLALLFSILGMFKIFWIFGIISTALIVFSVFRMFSRNINARLRENRLYIDFENKIRAYFKRDRKYFKYIKCPKCRKVTKVPKNKGKIVITCPYCKYEFIKKT